MKKKMYEISQYLQWNSNNMVWHMTPMLICSGCMCYCGSVACAVDPNQHHIGM